LDLVLEVGHFLLDLAIAVRGLSAAIYRRLFRSN